MAGNVGIVDDNNSSNKLLNADEEFTGEWFDLRNFASIIVSIKTDKDSAVDGLIIEHSSDGENVDGDDLFNIVGNGGKVFTFMPNSQYYRVRYINGGTTQTVFRLQSNLKRTAILGSSHRIQDSIKNDDDAELVKSIITAQDEVTGVFQNIQATNKALHVHSSTHEEFVAEGVGAGANVRKFGQRTTVGTTFVDIAQFTYDYSISSAQPFEMVCADANDTVLGTGARIVFISGVDGNGDLQEEYLETNGETKPFVNNYLWINRAYVTEVGSVGNNVGIITIKTTAEATPANAIYGIIEATEGQTLQAVYYIPNNYARFLLKKWGAGMEKGQDGDAKLQTRKYALGIGGSTESWRTRDIIHIYQTVYFLDYREAPMPITANSIVRVQAKTSQTNQTVTASFFGHEQDT